MGSSHRDAEAELNLPPGFRFHPTDDELVVHYLCRRAAHQRLPVPIIAEVDLYKFDPWELPEKALFGQREWYFFTPRDRKYPNGSRPNRAAGKGYWKATGADKPVTPLGYPRALGIKKALVFYHGKAPKGVKTDWIMHEYRLADTNRAASNKSSLRLDEWVLCRLYNKKNAWEKMHQQKDKPSVENAWEKMHQQKDKPSVETSESMQTGSESIWTPESEVDHESMPDLADLGYQNMTKPKEEEIVPDFCDSDLGHSEVRRAKPKEEDNDWFMGLNLDDLQGGYMGFGSEAPGLDMPMPGQEYYFPQLDLLPQMRLNDSLPPF